VASVTPVVAGHASVILAESKTLSTSDGCLSYAVAGTGPSVLAIQGVGMTGSGWGPQVDALSHQFRFITFDNRGIGGSSRGTDPLTIERMAADALALADAEGIERFHLLGHSMGGLIAQQVALTSRHRVQSLALLCTFADGVNATRLSWRMLILALRSRIGTRAMRRRGMIRMIMPDLYLRDHDEIALAERLGALFGRDLADQPPIIREQLRAMSRYSAVPRLRELSGVPTLVLSAAHDPIAPPAFGKNLASLIGGSRFIEFPDASHALPIQCAPEVNSLLLQHLTMAERG
jgi:aminoacrylate hydrolase